MEVVIMTYASGFIDVFGPFNSGKESEDFVSSCVEKFKNEYGTEYRYLDKFDGTPSKRSCKYHQHVGSHMPGIVVPAMIEAKFIANSSDYLKNTFSMKG